jgi:hypothetical protein
MPEWLPRHQNLDRAGRTGFRHRRAALLPEIPAFQDRVGACGDGGQVWRATVDRAADDRLAKCLQRNEKIILLAKQIE